MTDPRIAVIAGDGIGKEVVPAGIRVLSTVAGLDFRELPWGAEFYAETGAMMPSDGLGVLEGFDAIYLGAVGWPSVPDHVSLWGLLLPIRKTFQQYVNLRPVKLLPGIPGPLIARTPEDVDMLFFRENTEGEYSGTGGRVHVGTEHEVAIEAPVFSRFAIARVARAALMAAQERRRRLVSVTKSNASRYAYVLWDEVVEQEATAFPDVSVERVHVDAMAARMVLRPDTIDVVVGSNLFADILTDLGAALQGGLGVAASANLNPERDHPSMFEPVHGSAPDIAGAGVANPIGAILTGALLLRHLGLTKEAERIEGAVSSVTASGAPLSADLGGAASTTEITDDVIASLRGGAPSQTAAMS